MEEKLVYTISKEYTEEVITTTPNREAALAMAFELGEREGAEIVLSDNCGTWIAVNRFRKTYLHALETGIAWEDMGCSPLVRGDLMNERHDTDEFDPSIVYDEEAEYPIVGWKEFIQETF